MIKRSRACIACAKAKARCDNFSGACTRCASKNLQCEYRNRRACIAEAPDIVFSANSCGTVDILSLDHADTSHLEVDGTSMDFSIASNVDERFDCNVAGPDFPNQQALQNMSLDSVLHGPSDPSMLDDGLPDDVWLQAHMNITSIPAMPSNAMRCFARKPALQGPAKSTATMMKRVLIAYPTMMRTREFLPPFIHASYFSGVSNANRQPPESLTTCESLMQLLGSSTGGEASRRLVWKNIHLECDRVHLEVLTTLFWDVLQLTRSYSVAIWTRGSCYRPCKHC